MARTARRVQSAALLAAAAGAAGFAVWSTTRPGPVPRHAAAPDAAVIEQGRQVYAAQCASCHGATLEGQPGWRTALPSGRLPAPPHDRTGHT